MTGRQSGPAGPWREWLWSVLLGVGLALLCISLVNRLQPRPSREGTAQTAPGRRTGVEFTFGIHILLPEDRGG